MNAIPLMRIVIENAAFFALSGDDVINPDAAVAQLESMATFLKQLDNSGIETFVGLINRVAEEEERGLGTTDRVSFLRSLPQDFGLV